MTLRRSLVLLAFAALVAPASAHAQDPPPPAPPPPPVIADGVRIGGMAVGGLTGLEAKARVLVRFERPVRIRVRTRLSRVSPATLGAGVRVNLAVRAALSAPEGRRVRLEVVVNRRKLNRWIHARAERFNRPPRDSRLYLRRSLRPWITKPIPGRRLLPNLARVKLRSVLLRHGRGPVWLPTPSLAPALTRGDFSPVVVIRRDSRRLYLYRWSSGGIVRAAVFPVAVGQPRYPTPLGRFRIVTMQRNPWWYPPAAAWAAGASPIPPGPGNPLGTRWMGLSVGAVGIHGTPNGSSIGTAASHGCIRMHIGSAEWLFARVRIGTTVFIVGA